MRKILCFILSAVLLIGGFSSENVHASVLTEPDERWAEEYGWSKQSDRYTKTVDGVVYELWCGKNAYDQLAGNDHSWQIAAAKSEDAVEAVTIPGEIDGFPVKSIGSDAFRANAQITQCVISEGVELIAAGAFENCRNLAEISLSAGLKMIDAEAFYNCPGLSEITVPSSVEYVGKTAFCGESISGKGLEQLTFEGNAPEIIYAGQPTETGLEGLDGVAVGVYENTDGWEQEAWKNLKIAVIKENPPVPAETPEITEEPEVTTTPEVTEQPEVTATPEVTKEPEVTATPEVTEEPAKTVTEIFTDVYQDWYTEDVQYVYDKGWMTGIGGTGEFHPMSPTTKAQAVQVLYNMEGCPKVTDDDRVYRELKDVYREEWYAQAVSWAYQNGIITGDLNTKKFYPDAGITREQLALVLYRYAAYKAISVHQAGDIKNLINGDQVSQWSLHAVKWAVGAKVINGFEIKDNQGNVSGYNLAPQDCTSRAQMAAVLKRFQEMRDTAGEN